MSSSAPILQEHVMASACPACIAAPSAEAIAVMNALPAALIFELSRGLEV